MIASADQPVRVHKEIISAVCWGRVSGDMRRELAKDSMVRGERRVAMFEAV